MSFKLYSIESRKGGVGKTTIALNLAQKLLKQGPVLLLDCDITGTSISEPAANSAFWKDDAYVIKDSNDNPLNLLGYFLEKYNKADEKLDFQKDGNIKEKKINVIGSEIYGPSSRTIVDTRLLMDEIHSYWLMEFVDSLIHAFARCFPDISVSIVIDNSPGYVGFCQALHSYMYKLGPEKAKFVMVSSIDAQDLQACISASDEIRQEIKARTEVALYFDSKLGGDVVNPDLDTRMSQDAELKHFFFSLIDDEDLLKTYAKQHTEESFLSLIINKVPQTLKDDGFDFAYDDVIPAQQRELFHQITYSNEKEPSTIVLYDEAIAYQYYIRFLKEMKEPGVYDSYWTKRFRDLQLQVKDVENVDNRVAGVLKLDTLYSNLITNLNQRHYGRLAKTMQRAWAPSYPLGRIEDVMIRISRTPLISPMQLENQLLKEMLHVFIDEQLRELGTILNHQQDLKLVRDLVSYLEILAGYGREVKDAGSLFVLSSFIYIYVSMLRNAGSSDVNLHTYIKKQLDYPFAPDWKAYLGQELRINERLSLPTSALARKFTIYFHRLFDSFNYAILRIMEAPDDFLVLIEAVKLYVPLAGVLPLSKEMVEYLTDIIVRKTESFDNDRLAAIKANSYVMKSIQDVIGMILKKQNK